MEYSHVVVVVPVQVYCSLTFKSAALSISLFFKFQHSRVVCVSRDDDDDTTLTMARTAVSST